MDENLNFSFFARTIKEKLPTIMLFSLVGLLLGGYISFFWITPQYSSQTQMIAAAKTNEENLSNEITANLQLVKTYKELVLSDLVLGQVQEKLKSEENQQMSMSELREAITLEQQQESLFFSIRAVSDRPRLSAHLANITSQIFQLGIIPYTTSVDMKMSAKDKDLLKRNLSEDTVHISRRQRKRV